MTRSADYTIQGFIYQFNKTLFEILDSEENAMIDVEGIIEDIDIANADGITAIQCKYHESQENFQLNLVYKPILQMMNHYVKQNDANIKYKLFAYFPNETPQETRSISKENIENILKSTNKIYKTLIENIEGQIDIEGFLGNFILEFGHSLDDLTEEVMKALEHNGLDIDDIDTLHYPNAIQKIAELSIKHSIDERKINKVELLDHLREIKKTAITRWTISLKTLDKLVKEKKQQLKGNLSKNSRLRYFIISESLVDEFENEIVNFISDYIIKYHFKEVHDKTPLFCLDCNQELFNKIRVRLHKKQIDVKHGLITDWNFDRTDFLLEPRRWKIGKEFHRDFDIRLIRFNDEAIEIFNQNKPDDYYLFINERIQLDYQDTNVEHIVLKDIKQLKFILGMGDSYE
ncbi:hypothetical protein MKX79_04265 [Viridibacillus sp. FSL R5-0468]|uniref:hypothetical protein n=1 Tax=Viridibacillus sp. FSL R5-0468 TaxID=2921640 RepID=UPI0030F6882B